MDPLPGEALSVANAKSRRLRELVLAPEILVMPGAYDVLGELWRRFLPGCDQRCQASCAGD